MNRASFSDFAAKRGFTLIELSIVLVIIALIIGGVVAGRSLMRQSQVTSLIVDQRKYQDAVQAFQQKYTALPGDLATATGYWGIAAGTGSDTTCYASSSVGSSGTNTCNGNGDGQVNQSGTYADETYRAWQHLANAGFIQGRFTGLAGAVIPGQNMPAGRVDGSAIAFGYVGTLSNDANMFDGAYGHVFVITGPSTLGVPTGIITGGEAQSLDSKYDDGHPTLGNIRAFKYGAYSNTVFCALLPTDKGSNYITSTNDPVCTLVTITGF